VGQHREALLIGSYRVQLRPGFGFRDAADQLDYLADLGVSEIYLSPALQAAPGSQHGYDVVDHRRLSEDLGGEEAFGVLAEAARRHGIGIVMDIVPNHMMVSADTQGWWWEVLRFGPSSRYAGYFDIDWRSAELRLRQKVVLPILSDHVGRVLEAGGIRLERADEGVVQLRAEQMPLPLAPASLGEIVEAAASATGRRELALLGRSLRRITELATSIDELHDDSDAALDRVTDLARSDERVAGAFEAEIARINADPDRLERLLDAQHYRIARWRVASHELVYRRFFDVSSLVALRAEDPQVFADTHSLVLDLVARGDAVGLRIDHVDGLIDPEGYFYRLRHAAPRAWIVAEKILAQGEDLRATWPIDGTTGYDMTTLLDSFLTDPAGEGPMTEAYQELTGDTRTYEQHAVAGKLLVLRTSLASDVERLTELFVRICERRRRFRDFTRAELREALVQLAAHTGAYRSYVYASSKTAPRVTDDDRAYVEQAAKAAHEATADLDVEVFDLLVDILLLRGTGADERELALRFQQLTGPATAKGEEDTAFYTYARLLSSNEVGGNPAVFSTDVATFHDANRRRQDHWPASMLTTATHDTKRSEDVRARIAVLSEMPQAWARAVQRWSEHNERHKTSGLPDAATEWFVYMTLVGAHPIPLDRLWPVLEKSLREAKTNTSWLRPDEHFEAATSQFVAAVYADDEAMADVDSFVAQIADAGRRNALVQVALRMLCPGVPDTYQGCELWDNSLVDPDNRRPVDFAERRRLLDEVRESTVADRWRAGPGDGSAKLALVHTCLLLRRRRLASFVPGSYLPIDLDGPRPTAGAAFLRGNDVVVAVQRFPLTGGPAHHATTLVIPEGSWTNLVDGRSVSGGASVSLAGLCGDLPLAVLERS
jgi:(1->4)-alpha-D-glucan 1-alpha-D-glucosylmutase